MLYFCFLREKNTNAKRLYDNIPESIYFQKMIMIYITWSIPSSPNWNLMEVGQRRASWWAANLCAWRCHHQHCLGRTLDSTGHTRRRGVLPGEQVVCGCVFCGSWGLCHEEISDFIYLHNRLLFHFFSRLRYAHHKASEAFAHLIVAIRHIIIVTDYHWNKVPLC